MERASKIFTAGVDKICLQLVPAGAGVGGEWPEDYSTYPQRPEEAGREESVGWLGGDSEAIV